MSELLIKLGDETLINKINELARAHKRTPESEAEKLLRKAVSIVKPHSERTRIARKISAMTTSNKNQSDSTVLIREDRDR